MAVLSTEHELQSYTNLGVEDGGVPGRVRGHYLGYSAAPVAGTDDGDLLGCHTIYWESGGLEWKVLLEYSFKKQYC